MQVYVPDGYRLLETVFEEFVSRAFGNELKQHSDAYFDIQDGVRGSLQSILVLEGKIETPQVTDRQVDIEKLYSGSFKITKSGNNKLLHDYYASLLNGEIAREVGNSDGKNLDRSSRIECLRLLTGGAWGYFEKNQNEITTKFRQKFISKNRYAVILSANGDIEPVPAEWWQGSSCTEMFERLDFEHPDGVMLELVLTSHKKNTAAWRIDRALRWMLKNEESAADMTRLKRLEAINKDTKMELSFDGMLKAQDRLYELRPALKKRYTKSGA